MRNGQSVWLVHALGAVALSAHVVLTATSFATAAVLWQTNEDAPRATAIIGHWVELAPPGLGRWLTDAGSALTMWTITMAVVSAAAATLVLALSRGWVRSPVGDHAVLGWAMAFAVAAVPAYPIFTQDIWLSHAWGRMVMAGNNPYHQLFGTAVLEGLPLDHFPMPMTYGPIWALVCGAVMKVTGGMPWPAVWILKILLAACWIVTLALLAQISKSRPGNERGLTIAVFGWLPLSVSQSIAEAHNDIAMVAPAILWLRYRLADQTSSLYALTVSVLCKYVTASLILVELILQWVRTRGAVWTIVARGVGPALAAMAVFGLFYRSPAFFDGLRDMLGWQALRPADAIIALGRLIGLATVPYAGAVGLIFWLIAWRQLHLLFADPVRDRVICASLAVLCAVLFGAVSHIWPWFFVWPLAFAAAAPTWILSRFVVGAALAAPFALLFWWVPQIEGHKDLAALLIYGFAIVWMAASSRASLSARGDDSESPRAVRAGGSK